MEKQKKYKVYLSKNIFFLVKSRGLSYSKIARTIGLSRKTLQNWSAGEMPRNLVKLQQLADYLQVPLYSLLWSDIKNDGIAAIIDDLEFVMTIGFSKTIDGKAEKTFKVTPLPNLY